MAGGLAIVVVDFRTEAVDLVPDPVGWLLVAISVAALSLHRAAALAGLAALASTAEAYLPFHRISFDPLTGEELVRCPAGMRCSEILRYDTVSGWHLAAIAAALMVTTAALLMILRGLCRLAAAHGDEPAASRLKLLAVAVVIGWWLPPAIGIGRARTFGDGHYDPMWDSPAEYAAALGVLALGWVAVELCRRNGAGWAIPPGVQEPSRWRHG